MLDKNDPRLTAYLLDELSAEDRQAVEDAVQANPELELELEQLRTVIAQVQLAFDEELQSPSETISTLGEPITLSNNRSLRGRGHLRQWALVAVLLLCLCGIGYWLSGQPNNDFQLTGGSDLRGGIVFDGGIPEETNRPEVPQDREDLDGISEELRELILSTVDPLSWPEDSPHDLDGESRIDRFEVKLRGEVRELGDVEASLAEFDDSLQRDVAGPSPEEWHQKKLLRKRYVFSDEFISDGEIPILVDNSHSMAERELTERGVDPSSQTLSPGLEITVDALDGRFVLSGTEEETEKFRGIFQSLSEKESAEQQLPVDQQGQPGQQQQPAKPPQTWRRVNATPNTTRLMVGQNDELKLSGTQVHIQVDGFRARVIMDTFYYNDRPQILEGTFKLRLPDDASLFYFAFGDSVHDFSKNPNDEKELVKAMQTQYVSFQADAIGAARTGSWQNVKEARMVTREKAAYAYHESVRRRVDPALAEWSGAGVFQARVFPLQPNRMHRIVIGYDVNLQHSAEGLGLRFDLPEDAGFTQVEMSVDAAAADSLHVTPECVPVNKDQRIVYFWSNPTGNAIDLSRTNTGPRLLVSSPTSKDIKRGDTSDYFAAQFVPDLPQSAGNSSRRAIFLLDTSLSSNPDKFNVWLKLLEQTLTQNRDSLDSFAVLMFSVDQHFWREQYVANTPEEVQQLLKDCQQLVLEGATDLYAAARVLNETPWLKDDGPQPDVFLFTDGAATWGETAAPLIRAELSEANIGGLFAYQTGMSGTEVQTLRFLANAFGGAVFSVANESEIAQAATAHRQRPWQVNSITLGGATDLLTAGRVEWLYPDQPLMIAGRGEVSGPVTLQVQQGETQREIQVEFTPDTTCPSDFAARVYGQIAVTQLESLGTLTADASAAYARHYRVAGQTCSLVMLESEADYQRFDIRPEDDWLMIQTQAANSLVERTIQSGKDFLLSPNARFAKWLSQLESAPGLEFKIPPALKLVLDQIEVPVAAGRLQTQARTVEGVSEEYLTALLNEELDYDRIQAEAERRATIGPDDAVKVWSSLIERNPADVELLRDVAWSLMHLDRADQAFSLLRRVAQLRPFEGATYLALGNSLQQAGHSDLALMYYEIAMQAKFQRTGDDFRLIVANDYERLLQSIIDGHVRSSLKGYAEARLESLRRDFSERPELTVTLYWNTDRTDVDLHVTEPTEEICNYQHRKTRIGGRLTSDVTTGFGPEMYWIQKAPAGGFQIAAHYYSNDQNRTKLASRAFVTVVQRQESGKTTVSRHVARLDAKGDKQVITTIER